MRTSHTIYKVPDGKMVRIEMDYTDKIEKISISGDFFMHPEDTIEKIEKALVGIELEEEKIFDAIVKVAEDKKIEFFGVDASSLTRAILICGGKIEK